MKKFIFTLATVIVLCVPVLADSPHFASDSLNISSSSSQYNMTFSGSGIYVYATEGGLYFASLTQNATCVMSGTFANGSEYTHTYYANNSFIGDYVTTPAFYASLAGFPESYNALNYNPSISIYPAGTAYDVIYSDLIDYINSSSGDVGNKVTVHVPYGNVLYIKVDQRQEDIQLVAHMPKLSFLIPDRNFGYWGETGICWGDYNTLPYSGLTFPLNGMTGIDWQRDTSRNILGQTKTGVATKIMNTGVWYALFCPSLFGHFDLDSSSALTGASVDVTGVFSDIRLYPLSDTYSFVDNEVINGSDSEFQEYLDGESTESGTVTWTDQDGNVAAPRSGGSSYVPEAETAESLVSQIKNILGNIVKELQTLFTFGYDAIQTLVNLMSDFVSGFSQLYTWLPDPIYSVIISAVTIAIVIGVFKVFL